VCAVGSLVVCVCVTETPAVQSSSPEFCGRWTLLHQWNVLTDAVRTVTRYCLGRQFHAEVEYLGD